MQHCCERLKTVQQEPVLSGIARLCHYECNTPFRGVWNFLGVPLGPLLVKVGSVPEFAKQMKRQCAQGMHHIVLSGSRPRATLAGELHLGEAAMQFWAVRELDNP